MLNDITKLGGGGGSAKEQQSRGLKEMKEPASWGRQQVHGLEAGVCPVTVRFLCGFPAHTSVMVPLFKKSLFIGMLQVDCWFLPGQDPGWYTVDWPVHFLGWRAFSRWVVMLGLQVYVKRLVATGPEVYSQSSLTHSPEVTQSLINSPECLGSWLLLAFHWHP